MPISPCRLTPCTLTQTEQDCIEFLSDFADCLSDDFAKHHVATTAGEAESKALQRLDTSHNLSRSTVFVLSESDKQSLQEEVLFRNQEGFYRYQGVNSRLLAIVKDTHGEVQSERKVFRSIYPYTFITAVRNPDAPPTLSSGEGHLLYNVAPNGRVFLIHHLEDIEPFTITPDSRQVTPYGVDRLRVELRQS